ncbi:MAG: radical SAM protein [Candidatus Binataceae bacterium]
MKFELDAVYIEEACRQSALATRVRAALGPETTVRYVADGREAARPHLGVPDPFGAGKRRMIVMQRRGAFLMACPAGSTRFACCGYLVLALASNCPMDCSYCFLQEYLANNPGFQVYANYAAAFDELEWLRRDAPARCFRVGTGELADSLAFDAITGMSRDLVEYFATRDNLTLELKTKTDEIDNLLRIDPQGRTLVSWTLSPPRVHQSSEHRTAPPLARIAAARRVLESGYKVAFHLDPIIAYDDAARDYAELLDALFDTIAPARISFVSMGGLRMTPKLRATARRRFADDPMLCGEDVIAPDGRYRAFAPLRLKLYTGLSERIRRAAPALPQYLCMESASVHERVFGAPPAPPAVMGARLAGT